MGETRSAAGVFRGGKAVTEIKVNLGRIVGAIAGVVMEPYTTFIASLHGAGRVTDDEMEELRVALADRLERLGELVQARLREDDISAQPSLGPDPV